MKQVIYIFWSCSNKQEAKTIIHVLLSERIIACASIFPEIESIYRWEGNLEESREVKVVLKTLATHFERVQTYIQKHCSYEVPEILSVDISQGSSSYLSWLAGEVL